MLSNPPGKTCGCNYMTTSGQLFNFDKEGLQKAVDYQYQILMREIPEANKEPDNK